MVREWPTLKSVPLQVLKPQSMLETALPPAPCQGWIHTSSAGNFLARFDYSLLPQVAELLLALVMVLPPGLDQGRTRSYKPGSWAANSFGWLSFAIQLPSRGRIKRHTFGHDCRPELVQAQQAKAWSWSIDQSCFGGQMHMVD